MVDYRLKRFGVLRAKTMVKPVPSFGFSPPIRSEQARNDQDKKKESISLSSPSPDAAPPAEHLTSATRAATARSPVSSPPRFFSTSDVSRSVSRQAAAIRGCRRGEEVAMEGVSGGSSIQTASLRHCNFQLLDLDLLRSHPVSPRSGIQALQDVQRSAQQFKVLGFLDKNSDGLIPFNEFKVMMAAAKMA